MDGGHPVGSRPCFGFACLDWVGRAAFGSRTCRGALAAVHLSYYGDARCVIPRRIAARQSTPATGERYGIAQGAQRARVRFVERLDMQGTKECYAHALLGNVTFRLKAGSDLHSNWPNRPSKCLVPVGVEMRATDLGPNTRYERHALSLQQLGIRCLSGGK